MSCISISFLYIYDIVLYYYIQYYVKRFFRTHSWAYKDACRGQESYGGRVSQEGEKDFR